MSSPPTPVRAIAHALSQEVLSSRHGLSMSELSRRAGLAKETVRKQQRIHEYPPGQVPTIDLAMAERIADVLGTPVGELFVHPNGDPVGGVW